ncbi:uncharacterized protein LOC135392039 [Ornithodoros turicata]|uniref:uncharacterized protein LOC135392039 n=1 Tax=Ornithodoros turicata TaxID=34597 RepID=UPI0031397BE5
MQSFVHFPSYRKHVWSKHLNILQGGPSLPPTQPESGHDMTAPERNVDAPPDILQGESSLLPAEPGSGHDMPASESVDAPHDIISPDLAQGDSDAENQSIVQSDHDSSSAVGEPDHVKQFALLLLKWKESKGLPETTIDEIANDIICYVHGVTDDLTTKPVQQWAQILSSVGDGMEMLATKGGRTDYWTSCLPFVKPRTIALGTDERGKRRVFHYIPILEVLEKLLEVPDVYNNFYCPDREEGYLTTVFDGTAFRDHSYFKGDEDMICIQLYADEFEVCDPLGSKRMKHKLLGVYFSILNLPQRTRSSLSQIHLVLLVNDKCASKYGLDKVFAPLMEDIASLENDGITINGQTLKGTIFIVTGDNLSCHRLGGFKCSFSGGRICRFCLALRHEISSKHLEADFVLRTPESHLHHLNMLNTGIPTLSLYGVREPCPFNFTGFHPTEHMPPDIMHDIFEGVIPFVMIRVIEDLVSSGLFTLSHLNKCIEGYSYDVGDARNKPEKIAPDVLKGKKAMKGSASQIFCFFRHFALYVGDSVPSENSTWELYLLLRQIVELLVCRKLPTGYVPYLQRLIHFFCLDFQALFSHVKVPCKVHYLIHYPTYISKYGPLINLWAMRFESKHQYFKDLARKLHNFKNVTHTLAVRHQFHQAYILSEASKENSVFPAGSRPVLLEHVSEVVRSYVAHKCVTVTNISVLSSVRTGNITYRPGMTLSYSTSDDDLPKFMEICNIYSVDRDIVFEVRELLCVEFDRHFHVYVVTSTDRISVVNDTLMLRPEPLYVVRQGNRHVINSRSAIL